MHLKIVKRYKGTVASQIYFNFLPFLAKYSFSYANAKQRHIFSMRLKIAKISPQNKFGMQHCYKLNLKLLWQIFLLMVKV